MGMNEYLRDVSGEQKKKKKSNHNFPFLCARSYYKQDIL